ncbi:MAG: cation transporting ATPase C-terminal domain-containing protein [Rubritepida sp.]|nr:cation transporting ATPase C-terminal domain-containing protein [Rubritepida sp.]
MLPVSAAQLLWINTVTTIALGLTLAFEPTEAGVMARPPQRPGATLLQGAVVRRMLLVGLLIALAAFAGFEAVLAEGRSAEAARTLAVNLIVALEVAYLFTVRGGQARPFSPTPLGGTPAVWGGIALVLLAQLAFTHAPPLQALFRTEPLAPADWALVAGAMLAFWLLLESEKALGARLAFARSARRSKLPPTPGGQRP